MGISPGNIANRIPPRGDDLARRQKDLQRTARENAAAPSLASSTIGGGGVLTVAGSLNVTGSISVPGTLASAGAVTAGTNVTAGTSLNGQTLATSSDANVGGILRNVAAYSNPITTSYRAVWVTSVDGQFGFNLSSREFKQDITDFAPDPATILQLQLVTFRYIAAVELEGDAAEVQVGLIAEEVHDLGLTWLVEYDNGKPCGIKFHLIAMALIAVAQDHESRLANLEMSAASGAE